MVKRFDELENGCIPMHCGTQLMIDVLVFVYNTVNTLMFISLSSRLSSSEGWRQQLTIPVYSSSIALCPLTSPLAECTCTPSNLLCR